MPVSVVSSEEFQAFVVKTDERFKALESGTVTPTPPTPTPTPSKVGVYVPLFVYPTRAEWNTVVSTKQKYPNVAFTVCFNPSSGVGGSQSQDYVTGVNKLKAAGCKAIGYVYTSYGSRDPVACKAEIDKYKTWYNVDGIFFDEMSNTAGKEQYYKDLNTYCKMKGMTITIGNPGTSTRESFVGSLDCILIYESGGYPDVAMINSRCFNGKYPISNFGNIPYGCATLDSAKLTEYKKSCGWIYITNDTLSNPWDSLPIYFSQLVEEIGK